MPQIILSSSILSADFSNLQKDIRLAEGAGVDWLHIDVMDGVFVPNISMGPFIVETCRKITELPLDIHLMIQKPELHINSFVDAGADKISIHIEDNPNVHRTLQTIKQKGCQPGIVLNPGTPASAIGSVLNSVDMVLVMSVNPGFSGQKFIPEMTEKIAKIKIMLQEIDSLALIQVDGGITHTTLPKTFKAGASVFVAATSIFKHPEGIQNGVAALRNSI
ncbi:MAG: ribulose-phosphate 3-epimerase [Bacteroidales bacterium]|nr:ribulose-phosphate 3-epimerase [Bacteroidales bacterium]